MNAHPRSIIRPPRRHARSRAWRCVAGQTIAVTGNAVDLQAAGTGGFDINVRF